MQFEKELILGHRTFYLVRRHLKFVQIKPLINFYPKMSHEIRMFFANLSDIIYIYFIQYITTFYFTF